MYQLFFNTFSSCRLDRKSSRGMIYENEELRLRTININAEVERGKYRAYIYIQKTPPYLAQEAK